MKDRKDVQEVNSRHRTLVTCTSGTVCTCQPYSLGGENLVGINHHASSAM